MTFLPWNDAVLPWGERTGDGGIVKRPSMVKALESVKDEDAEGGAG